jgi:hypothetical protein
MVRFAMMPPSKQIETVSSLIQFHFITIRAYRQAFPRGVFRGAKSSEMVINQALRARESHEIVYDIDGRLISRGIQPKLRKQ